MQQSNFTLADATEVLMQTASSAPDRALILMHGRGASAENILRLRNQLTLPDTTLVLAPQAHDATWYPQRFIEPQTANEPYLSQSLKVIDELVSYLGNEHGLPPSAIVLAGFSQGACLVAEYIKRNPRRYQGIAILSGGLIGSDAEVAHDMLGSLARTPIYLGCDEQDFHIPAERARQSATYFQTHEADVTFKLYQNLGHTIHPDGISSITTMVGEISVPT